MRLHSSLAKENKRTRVLLQKCPYDLIDEILKEQKLQERAQFVKVLGVNCVISGKRKKTRRDSNGT